ncbi:MAG: Rieske 2Fe-2S domain-containing protein, partial [Actinobacteria bacterium]|nr:Rieske 2Fe-2S domain-containing protein [Actinomycetota bacterium]
MAMLTDGRTLPFDWYSDPAVQRLERERIFRRSWQYAGRADQVAGPGSFFTCEAGEVPIVVVRDEEGGLRAFVNVCRHRGSLVCEGEGRR